MWLNNENISNTLHRLKNEKTVVNVRVYECHVARRVSRELGRLLGNSPGVYRRGGYA